MPNPSTRSTQQIQGGLIGAVRTLKDERAVVPARFAPYTPEELYQRFLVVMPDHKGNLSSTIGEYGRELAVDLSFDFGDLILPGFTSLDVKVGAKGELLSVALMIIHRNAPKILAGSSSKSPTRWQGGKPVCFLSMSGKRQVLTLSLDGNFDIGNSFTSGAATGTNPESIGLAMTLSAEANLKAGVALKGQLMHLRDKAPGWYVNGNDAGLQADFKTVLGAASKKALKQEVVSWFEYILEMVALQLNEQGYTAKLQSVQTALKKLNGGLDLAGQLQAIAADETKSMLGDLIQQDQALSTLEQIIDIAQKKLDGTKTQELLKDLDKLETLYEVYAKSSTIGKIQLQQIKEQIAWYKASLTAAKSAEQTKRIIPTKSGATTLKAPYQQLSFLSVFSFIPSASGSATAGAEAKLNADGSIQGEAVGANAKIAASVGVQAEGQMGFTSYRYQSFALSDKGIPLVSTQDTQLSYRQATINATVIGELGAEVTDYGLEKGASADAGKEFVYNMLTYRSVQTFWQYNTPLITGTDKTVSLPMEQGSGLSFGVSVSFGKLVRIARQLAGKDPAVPKDQQLLTDLARQLRVKLADLKAFITAAKIEDDADSELTAYSGIILEANHAFKLTTTTTTTVDVKRKSNSFLTNKKQTQYRLPDMLSNSNVKAAITALKTPETPTVSTLTPTLASIRLRVRLADHTANENTLFQLGFKLAAGLNISLNKIQRVGTESVLDVYTHWFAPYTTYNRSNATDAYEQSVPAVALLHQ